MATLIEMVNLAKRNNWDFSMETESNRPYFMKNGNYAVPDENTSKEDKVLLASIISEGSEELQKAILIAWENGLNIAGPCSGISSEHKNPPHSLHFGITGPSDITMPICESLKEKFPEYSHMLRDAGNDIKRYDLTYFLQGKELSKEESNKIFKEIVDSLEIALNIHSENKVLS